MATVFTNEGKTKSKQGELLAPNRLLTHLHRLLIDSATAQGGNLTVEKLEDLMDAVRQELANQMSSSAPGHENSLSAFPPAYDSRSDLIGRIVVSRFESILRTPDNNTISDRNLPRSIIPPFFRALRMMIGTGTLDEVQATLDQTVDEMKKENPAIAAENLWDSLKASPQTCAISVALFVRISMCFDKYDYRKDWFVRLLNTMLGGRVLVQEPTILEPNPSSMEWFFEPRHFVELMNCLSQDCRNLLNQPNGPKTVEESFEEGSLKAVQELISKIDADN